MVCRFFGSGVVVLVSSCSLFSDLSGYSSGQAPAQTPVSDGGADVAANTSNPGDADVDAATDAGANSDGATFVDDFNRADGPIGNGWIEKTPNTVAIAGGRLMFSKTGVYEDLLVTRQPSEDLRDVEVSADFRFTGVPGGGSPDAQIFARVQQATIGMPGGLHGYILWVENYATLKLGRQEGTSIVDYFGQEDLPSNVEPLHVYRLRLRVTGTSPVQMEASCERRDVNGTEWTTLVAITAADDAPKRIQNAGTVGTASDEIAPFMLESFTRTAL